MVEKGEMPEKDCQSVQSMNNDECKWPSVVPISSNANSSDKSTQNIPDISQVYDHTCIPPPMLDNGRLDRAHILQNYRDIMMSIQEEQRVIYKDLKGLSQKAQLWANAASKLDNIRGVKRLNESLDWIDAKELQISHSKQDVSLCVEAVERALSVLGTPIDNTDHGDEAI